MLDNVIRGGYQGSNVSDLEHVTRGGGITADLSAFLIDSRCRELSEYTLADYKRFLSEFVGFLRDLGVTDSKTITRQHVQLFLVKKRETCNKESVLHYFRDIRRFLYWLRNEGSIPSNPLTGWKPPKADEVLIKPFEDDQLRALLYLCDESFLGLRNRALILLMLDTGLRKREVAEIMIRDVDMEHELITTMGKGNHERFVRIGRKTQRALLAYLRKRKDQYPNLWVSEEGEPLLAGAIYQMVRKLGKLAGLSGVRCSPHTFRHTFGTRSMDIGTKQNNGAIARQVQELMGHKTAYMTRIYTKTLASKWAAEAHKKFSPVDNLAGL